MQPFAEMHAQLLTALGATDQEDAMRIIADHHARALHDEVAKLDPKEWAVVPRTMHLDANALAVLAFMAGSAVEGASPTDPEAWSGAVLHIVHSVEDDGKTQHGLAVFSAEYPEEGGVLLAEFPEILRGATSP